MYFLNNNDTKGEQMKNYIFQIVVGFSLLFATDLYAQNRATVSGAPHPLDKMLYNEQLSPMEKTWKDAPVLRSAEEE